MLSAHNAGPPLIIGMDEFKTHNIVLFQYFELLVCHSCFRHRILRHVQLGKKMIQDRCQKGTIQAGIHQLHLVIMMIHFRLVVFQAFGEVNEIGNDRNMIKRGN